MQFGGLGKSRICRFVVRLDTQGRVAVRVQNQSAGRISSCSGDQSLFYLDFQLIG